MSSQVFIINKILTTNKVDGIKGNDELIKKCGELLKIRKLSKSQKLAKLKNDLSKSRNLSNFNTKKNRSNFLISNTRIAFNCLQLAFTKALIL